MILTSKLAYYHVPKTGGTWAAVVFEQALSARMVGLKHATPEQEEPPEDRFAFCYIRHPLDWYVSYWRFREGGRGQHPDPWFKFYGEAGHILDEIDECGDPSFDRFMEKVLANCPGAVGRLYDRFRSCYWIKYENLRHTLARLLDLAHGEDAARVALELAPVGASDGPQVVWQPAIWRAAFDSERETIQHWYNYL